MKIRFLHLLAFLLFTAALAFTQTYTITDLGALPGDNESSGFWLNNLGDVVGCSDTQTSEGYPCTGLVAGQHAFYWQRGHGMKDLGVLPGATVSGAIGVSDLGTVVGYSNVKGQPATNFVAVQWSPTGAITNLGVLAGGSSSAAFQVNSAGEITGDSFLKNGIVNATLWSHSKIKNLGSLPNAIFTSGLAINDRGLIVGESVFTYGPPFKSHGFLWNGSTMKDLGTLWGGITSIASAINTAGDIAGHGNISTNAPHAMVWTANSGMKDLNTLIPPNTGWELINANAINNVGQITGYGSRNGHNHAFLLTPIH